LVGGNHHTKEMVEGRDNLKTKQEERKHDRHSSAWLEEITTRRKART